MAQTASGTLKPAPHPQFNWVDKNGVPTQAFRDWVASLDAIARAGLFGPLVSAASDAAAQAAGVPVNGLYQNAGVVQIRLV